MEEYEATLIEIRNHLTEMEKLTRSIGGITYSAKGACVAASTVATSAVKGELFSRIETVRTLVNRLEAEMDNSVQSELEDLMKSIK